MNLRSNPLIQHDDLQFILREKRKLRAEIRKQKPEQQTNLFIINHVDIPIINSFSYFPKYNLITGTSQGYYQAWKLVDDQVHENHDLNNRLQLKQIFNTRHVSFMVSNDTIIKQCYLKFEMFDYFTLNKINFPSINDGKLIHCKYITENSDPQQIIFLKEFQYIAVARQKTFKIMRTIFNPYLFTFIDQSKYILLIYGQKRIKMFVNTKNTTKLIRTFEKHDYNRIAFNGRLLSHSNLNRSISETTIIDVSNMKIKANLYKDNDNCLQSLFIKQLGLFLVLYVKSLDIYDSQQFQMIGCELLPDNKLHNKRTYTMAYHNELIIFYQTKRELTKRKLKNQKRINKDLLDNQ